MSCCSSKGSFKCYVTLFTRKFDPHHPLVTLIFPGKLTPPPPPPRRYVTVEWLLMCPFRILFLQCGSSVFFQVTLIFFWLCLCFSIVCFSMREPKLTFLYIGASSHPLSLGSALCYPVPICSPIFVSTLIVD